jgi:integrase
MALDTLARLGDILALRREQDHRTYLTILNPKTNAPYKVPISTRLRAALDAVPKAGLYYFPHRRHAENPRDYRSGVRQLLKRACKAARIRFGRKKGGITFHGLRHTGASRMVEAGIDLRTVQEIGGWSSLRQLARYAHPSTDAKRQAVEAVSQPVRRPRAGNRTGMQVQTSGDRRGLAGTDGPSRRVQ